MPYNFMIVFFQSMLAKKVYKQTCQELAKTYKMPVKESTLSVLAVINDIVITYLINLSITYVSIF